jgi:phosphoglycerate dehydrogenase-like enzyme
LLWLLLPKRPRLQAEPATMPGIPDGSGSGLSSERVPVGVLGGGAWGTALALHAARMGHDVLLWALEEEAARDINEAHENKMFLPVRLPGSGTLL